MKMRFIVGILAVSCLSLWLSSCKDDPVPISGVTFEIEEEFVKESDGTIQSIHPLLISGGTGRTITVKILLDKPLAETAVIAYSIGGTAKKNSTTNPIGDFEIVGNNENITVLKDATEASITIKLYEDYSFEAEEDDDEGFYETIELKLESVISGTAIIGEQDTYVLTIYEDDTVIFLDWDSGDGTTGDVDMDILVALNGEFRWGSTSAGTEAEGLALPAGFPDGTYGMAYTYYSGTSDDLEFYVDIINLGGTLNSTGTALSYTKKYTLANINTYDNPSHPDYKGDPKIVQNMTKNGFNYSNVSNVTVPSSGSRISPLATDLKNRLKRTKKIKSIELKPGSR